MDDDTTDRIKDREIAFRGPHDEPRQAATAARILANVDGVLRTEAVHPHLLRVRYDITCITLQVIEEFLSELGFHLDNSLMSKLKRALFYYAEEAQQASLGCKRGRGNCTQAVFIQRYQQLKHGCRDDRPDYWRRYL